MSLFAPAEFFRAVHRFEDLPPDRGAEVAFAGRSNAGKSSAINALVNRRRLAHVSKAPGRTQTINFFSLGGSRFLVDLPGYGYASVARQERARWGELINAYLTTRDCLRGLVLIADIRRSLTAPDRQLIEWFAPAARPIHVLLTKADKLTAAHRRQALKNTGAELRREHPGLSVQLFSSETRDGVAQAQQTVSGWLA
ncbi:MAG: YihA family ribosome biogenesis GTP-binding protein [Betaproteobacteria bacterium]|nr:YihA family ribosome biogenesis GTP-binding protein [Betaproteobacteria bacterium]MBI2509660.1 YihA family ribosome biogenesis GTP-binding protein [Betaproteobacteria bacterium]